MKYSLLAACLITSLAASAAVAAPELTLVEAGAARMPIIVAENAPPFTRRAAGELADYIGRISGAKPVVVEGLPNPVPEHAIWVGFQPGLTEIFPKLDFDFEHPEEILISCDGRNLVIAGRDRLDPNHMTVKGHNGKEIVGVQQEYGTVNAVHTFLQDHLGVRWLWPGELGEDVVKQATLRFKPFTVRYHPQIRGRRFVFMIYPLERNFTGNEWARHQRLQLDSLLPTTGGWRSSANRIPASGSSG